MTSLVKVIATCMLLSISMQMCRCSAIPIWELLRRDEKVSHLYSTFAQLVSVHCKVAATNATPVNECKRNLVAYGYERLQSFDDEKLDSLDPYQRGANELIWSAIMQNHARATLVTTRRPSVPTPPDSSLIILTPGKEASTASVGQNPIFHADPQKQMYSSNMDSNQQPQQDATSMTTFLTGPLVFRVRPDGSPVEDDRFNPRPVDDDMLGLAPKHDGFSGNAKQRNQVARIARQPQTIMHSGYFYGAGL